MTCVCGHPFEDHGPMTGRCKHPNCGCLTYLGAEVALAMEATRPLMGYMTDQTFPRVKP